MVVYHLQKKSGNFGWNVNGKTNLVFPNGKFLGKTGFLERWTKFPNGISERKIVRSIRSFWPVPGLSDWIAWSMKIPIRDLTLSIYHTRRPIGFSDQMVNNPYKWFRTTARFDTEAEGNSETHHRFLYWFIAIEVFRPCIWPLLLVFSLPCRNGWFSW